MPILQGAGIAEGSVSDYVMAMRVVDGRGQLKSYNVMQHPNVMRALQCCVGMCGVIYDVTLQVTKYTSSVPVTQLVNES